MATEYFMATEHFNGLTEAEAERIALLMEECGEVIQICGKILRHGYESFNPFDKSKATNRELLQKEIIDVVASMQIMEDNNDVFRNNSTYELRETTIRHTINKKMQYMHHNYDVRKDIR